MRWLRRHWKWIVPSILALVAGTFLLVINIIKSSEPYEMAMAAVREDARAVAMLGTPIEDGLMPQGSIQTSGASGAAQLGIPVSGPRGEGIVFARASMSAGQWTFDVLVLQVGDERIDLVEVGDAN